MKFFNQKFYIFSFLIAPLTALYFCAYLIPYINSKGALSGFIIGLFIQIILIILKFQSQQTIRYFANPCAVEVLNDINKSVDEIIKYYKTGTTTAIAILNEPYILLSFIEDMPLVLLQLIVFGVIKLVVLM